MALPLPESDSDRLDRVIYYLERLDKRDRARTVGSFLRFAVVWGFVILSTWYAIEYGPQLIEKITQETMKKITEQSQGDAQKLLEQLQGKKKR